MKRKYEVYPALHDESNAGWIWMSQEEDFASRDYISVVNMSTDKKVLCICRIIDANFKRVYKERTGKAIQEKKNALVVSDYYRKKLGLDEGKGQEISEFEIGRVVDPVSKIRTLLQHPDNIVKIVTWLAIISVAVGLVSILTSIWSLRLSF